MFAVFCRYKLFQNAYNVETDTLGRNFEISETLYKPFCSVIIITIKFIYTWVSKKRDTCVSN